MVRQRAVNTDIDASQSMPQRVVELCVSLGASANDLVPFEVCNAARSPASRRQWRGRLLPASPRSSGRTE